MIVVTLILILLTVVIAFNTSKIDIPRIIILIVIGILSIVSFAVTIQPRKFAIREYVTYTSAIEANKLFIYENHCLDLLLCENSCTVASVKEYNITTTLVE